MSTTATARPTWTTKTEYSVTSEHLIVGSGRARIGLHQDGEVLVTVQWRGRHHGTFRASTKDAARALGEQILADLATI